MANETMNTQPEGNTPVDVPVTPEPSSTPQGADPTPVETPSDTPDWHNAFGESADKVKDFGSIEALVEAAERGKAYVPAKDVKDYDLGIQATTDEDKLLQDSFKQYCLEQGVTPNMAKALTEWNIKTNAAARQAQYEQGVSTLKEKWGMTYDEKVNGALQMVTVLDKVMEGKLSKELAYSGGNNNPVIIETLYRLSTLISEDSLAGANAGGGEMKPVTTIEFLKSDVFKNKE